MSDIKQNTRPVSAVPKGDHAKSADGLGPDAVNPGLLRRISRGIASIEAPLAGLLIAGVFLVLIGNVVSRGIGRPLIWTDELAVHLMIWAAMVGGSLALASREHIAVTLVPDLCGALGARILALLVDLLMLLFFACFALLLWGWFDLLGLMAAGGAEAHGMASYNFMWSEPTVTLGVRKVWFWAVMPVFCVTGTLHVLASLADQIADLRKMMLGQGDAL